MSVELRQMIERKRVGDKDPTSSSFEILSIIIKKRFEILRSEIFEVLEEYKVEHDKTIQERAVPGEKGDAGVTPTDEQLIALIQPLIPPPLKGDKGDTPTINDLVALIKPLIPKAKDGKTPTKKELLAIIKPLIKEPQIIHEVRKMDDSLLEKIREEYKEQIEELKDAIRKIAKQRGGGGSGNTQAEIPVGTINGSNMTFTLAQKPKTNSTILLVNGQVQRIGSDFTIVDKTITMLWAIPTGSDIFAYYVRS